MGLRRGGIHARPGQFFIFVWSFSPFRHPAPHASAERAVGARSCARNLNPLVIKSELYATAYGIPLAPACGSRTFTRKSEMYTGRLCVHVWAEGRGYLFPFACPDISVACCTRATASRPADVNNTTKSLPDTYVFFFLFVFSNGGPFSRTIADCTTPNASTRSLVKRKKQCNHYNCLFLFVLPLCKCK